MGEKTGISWTDSTVNVWHGCEKVDTLCKHCYAEESTPVRVKRAGVTAREAQEATEDSPAVKRRLAVAPMELWGGLAARSETKSWERDMRKWNAAALKSGEVHRVFGQSLSDTFEDYHGGEGVRLVTGTAIDALTLDVLRARFLAVAAECCALTFQLLTKRPENVRDMVPASWLDNWPAHVWIGCTVEDQKNADRRIPHLLRIPAAVRFLSVEPQIGPVDLTKVRWTDEDVAIEYNALTGESWVLNSVSPSAYSDDGERISWVICGGESGSKARPFDLAWARSLRDQCKAAGALFFLKQLGANPINSLGKMTWTVTPLRDSHGGNESEWPDDLRDCRAFPS